MVIETVASGVLGRVEGQQKLKKMRSRVVAEIAHWNWGVQMQRRRTPTVRLSDSDDSEAAVDPLENVVNAFQSADNVSEGAMVVKALRTVAVLEAVEGQQKQKRCVPG
jgi:hypothetical protein